MKKIYSLLFLTALSFSSNAQCTGPTAVCQNINVYLDQSGSATITGADIDGGSTDDCNTGSLSLAASQTTFTCADLPTGGGKLVITGAYDGPLVGGLPKGIELYVDGNIADLSVFGVGSANNGGGTDGQEFTFPAVPATDGTFIYVSADSAGFFDYFGFQADFVSGSMLINGDDAVELFQGGVVIDVFGDINLDGTGTGWDYLDGWAYRNDFIPINNGVWTETDFYYSGINAMDLETTNATAAVPFPLASFITAGSDIAVTLTVMDGLMNEATCIALVTVMDTLAPNADVTTLADVTAACQIDSIPAPTATDNCSGSVTGTTTASFPITTQGTTVVTWTYADGLGNTSMQTQNVVITDATAPIANVPTLTPLTNACEVTPTPPTATDDCEGAITGTTTTTFPITASTTITWAYDDGNGNSSTQDQTVTITGLDVTTTSTLPTITANATGVTYQWFNCTTNTNVAGAASQSFTVTVTGDYAVIITSGNCSDTSACVNVNTDGIEELIDLGMSVSPNPSKGKFNVTFDQVVAGNLLVFDANGRIVEVIEINNNSLTVDLSAFQSGLYIMQVATESGVSRTRIVKD